MDDPRDEDWMRSAINLGRRGLGTTWPNPSVGCIIVKDNVVVGRGTTQPGGRPHAEVVALSQAGEKAKGATVYVSLEPCAHHGKSPPCAEALINAGVERVVCAISDPDPRVDGGGIAMLKAAGINVRNGVCATKARAAHQGFVSCLTRARPHVVLKLATTLDGAIATKSNESKWITGPASRRLVHIMRGQSDAVMVGRGTIEADDPRLDIRDLGMARHPVRIAIDSRLKTPKGSRLVQSAHKAPTWLVHGPGAKPPEREALTGHGCKLIEVPVDQNGLDLKAALAALSDLGITRVFCEGGATLAASLIKEGLADEIVIFSAGKVMGADGLRSVGAMQLEALADAPVYDLVETRQCGRDVMCRWALSTP